jgi:hypothetical protein
VGQGVGRVSLGANMFHCGGCGGACVAVCGRFPNFWALGALRLSSQGQGGTRACASRTAGRQRNDTVDDSPGAPERGMAFQFPIVVVSLTVGTTLLPPCSHERALFPPEEA